MAAPRAMRMRRFQGITRVDSAPTNQCPRAMAGGHKCTEGEEGTERKRERETKREREREGLRTRSWDASVPPFQGGASESYPGT